MDMFAEHFREANPKGNWGETVKPDIVKTDFDSSGQMIYLRRGRVYGYDGNETGAWKHDGSKYTQAGSLLDAPVWPRNGTREVEAVETALGEERKGIASTLWHVAGQGTDLRHSDKRTHNGYDWSHKVGGKSVSGRDVSTEPKTLEEAKAQGIIKEDDR